MMAFEINLRTGPRLKSIAVEKITPNPHQPRRIFEPEALARLSKSIARYGVITPLTVRKTDGGEYMLIAGERRLKASKMAGLGQVPCYIIEAGESDAAVMALVENLQRRDLDPFEEAEGLLHLTKDLGMTQQRAAELIGKSQAAVANKMRLLKLAPETIEIIRENDLTERHARALLALGDPQVQADAAQHIAKNGLNVAQSEKYIASIASPPPHPIRKVYIKDVRFFLNTVNKAVKSIKTAGIPASCTTTQRGRDICLEIVIQNGK